jgi:hypothetical protein
MTGFGCGNAANEKGAFTVEIKAVNSRFLEINMKGNYVSPELENYVKKLIKEKVQRGKLYVSLSFAPAENGQDTNVTIDRNLLQSYMIALNEIRHMDGIKNNKVTISDLLSLPDSFLHVSTKPMSDSELQPLLEEALIMALNQLDDMKVKEGSNLASDLQKRIEFLYGKLDVLKSMQDKVVDDYKTRLQERIIDMLKKVDAEIDESRLLQEVAIYSEKTDFTEELVRLESHLKQFSDTFNHKEPVGRRLDFLLQEMNREINTTASKANDIKVIDCVIIVKTELEKMREQVQNIE